MFDLFPNLGTYCILCLGHLTAIALSVIFLGLWYFHLKAGRAEERSRIAFLKLRRKIAREQGSLEYFQPFAVEHRPRRLKRRAQRSIARRVRS